MRHSATFLPEVAFQQGWDKLETIRHLISKSGCGVSSITEILQSLRLTRYQSSKSSLTYSQYLNLEQYRPDEKIKAALPYDEVEDAITVPA